MRVSGRESRSRLEISGKRSKRFPVDSVAREEVVVARIRAEFEHDSEPLMDIDLATFRSQNLHGVHRRWRSPGQCNGVGFTPDDIDIDARRASEVIPRWLFFKRRDSSIIANDDLSA